MLLKLAHTERSETTNDLQSYLILANGIKAPECSIIIYYKVLHHRCDSKETLLCIINDLYLEFISTGKKKHIFWDGDQVTYERLQSIKREYGQDLSWLFPFPGDWHFLKNYQEVLFKIYYDAGLCQLATASGYLPKSVRTNFKCAHNFLNRSIGSFVPLYGLMESTRNWILSLPPSTDPTSAQRNLNEIMFDDLSETYDFQHK